jgi:hypothetical protein
MGAEAIDFIPRATRYGLNVPVMLYLPDDIASGRTINISETGILATFDRSLDPWATGRLCAEVRRSYLSIEVRVVRVEGRQTGMTFHIVTEGDHAAIRELIEFAQMELAAVPPAPAA